MAFRSEVKYTIEPAQDDDLPQILDIYTYYVLNTTISLLIHKPDLSYIIDRYHQSREVGLPYLVAVADPVTRAEAVTDDPLQMHRRVLAYIYTLPFSATKLGYAPSVELTLYVHHKYLGRGVGRAMMTKLIIALSSCRYQPYETGAEHLASVVKVRNLYAICSTDLAELDEHENEVVKDGWRARGEKTMCWYEQLEFQNLGRLKAVGEKLGRSIDVTYLCKNLE